MEERRIQADQRNKEFITDVGDLKFKAVIETRVPFPPPVLRVANLQFFS
jgi:hypothetical protein